jgi:hypothetical protein
MTTKQIIYQRPGGEIAIGMIGKDEFTAITLHGGLIRPEDVDWETQKQMLGGIPVNVALRWARALAFGGLTEAAALALVAERDRPKDTISTLVVEHMEVARQDRYFRNAWECSQTGTMNCNMTKARVWHMNRIRDVRNVELVKLDLLSLRALETGNTVERDRINRLKQVLRDIPQTFDLTPFATTAELKAAWPAELPRN